MKRNLFFISILLLLVFALNIDMAISAELEEFKVVLEKYSNACKDIDAEAMAEIEGEAYGFGSSGLKRGEKVRRVAVEKCNT